MTIAEQIFAAYEELQNQAAGVKTVYLRYTALPSEEQKKQMGDVYQEEIRCQRHQMGYGRRQGTDRRIHPAG